MRQGKKIGRTSQPRASTRDLEVIGVVAGTIDGGDEMEGALRVRIAELYNRFNWIELN